MNRITALAAAITMTAGSLAVAAPTQAAPAQAKSYKVTARANIDTAVAREDKVKIRGRVTPKAAGQKVVLQQRVDGRKRWSATGKATVKKNGTYVLKDTPSTAGSREYRVLKPASRGIAKGISKPVTVLVYGWQKLAYVTPGPSVNMGPANVLVGAADYGQSLATDVSGTPASIEYTLGRKCTHLRATYALTDSSATGSSGAITVSADGALLASHSLAVGTIVADQVLDISDVFRLKFDASTTASPAAIAAVATPEVLCAP